MLDIIRSRRSIRRYADRPVEEEKIIILKETLLRAPSARNSKPCEFIFVNDKRILRQLAVAKPSDGEFIAAAPLAIVVCGDATKSDLWIEDCSIAASYVQLAAVAVGLGSCWIQIRGRKHDDSVSAESFLQELLEMPTKMKVEAIIAIGYPGEDKPPRSPDELKYEKIHVNSFIR